MSRMPFFDWSILGSRLSYLFVVHGGAAISVASTMVPLCIIKPFLSRMAIDCVEDLTRNSSIREGDEI